MEFEKIMASQTGFCFGNHSVHERINKVSLSLLVIVRVFWSKLLWRQKVMDLRVPPEFLCQKVVVYNWRIPNCILTMALKIFRHTLLLC